MQSQSARSLLPLCTPAESYKQHAAGSAVLIASWAARFTRDLHTLLWIVCNELLQHPPVAATLSCAGIWIVIDSKADKIFS